MFYLFNFEGTLRWYRPVLCGVCGFTDDDLQVYIWGVRGGIMSSGRPFLVECGVWCFAESYCNGQKNEGAVFFILKNWNKAHVPRANMLMEISWDIWVPAVSNAGHFFSIWSPISLPPKLQDCGNGAPGLWLKQRVSWPLHHSWDHW